MVKVLFFIENLTEGGAEKVLRNLVNHMDQTKFDITVQTTFPADAKKYLAPGIHYKPTYPVKNRVNMLRYRLETAAGLTYRLHLQGEYDIEAAYLECGATKIMAGSTNKNSVKLAWVHCELKRGMADIATFVRKTKPWYQKYDKVICVSEAVRDDYLELFGNKPGAVVIHNTVDDAEIIQKAREPLLDGVSKKKTTLVLVGRLAPQKNVMRFLEVHKRLLNDGFEHDVWILGEGPERPSLEQYIRENQLENSATLFGFQENPYPFMLEADLLVCSSIYEGFSTFVTEGLILGKPIVTTDCSGMKELLGESEYGLITVNNTEGLYNGIRQMLAEPELLDHYAEQAQKRSAYFRTEALVHETESYLLSLMGEKHD